MKKEDRCKHCENTISEYYVCDTCGKNLSDFVPITIQFGYGHYLDEIEVHFCTDQCMMQYMIREWEKRPKDNRFIYGEGE